MHGQVQGVGFRWWTRSRALELGLVGSASNLADGRVEVIAEGGRTGLRAAARSCWAAARTPGAVSSVSSRYGPARGGLRGFSER